MYALPIRRSSRRLVTYTLIIVAVGFFGFLILKEVGILRQTVTLDTNFQTTSLTQVKMVTVLSRDAISAIKRPRHLAALEAEGQMRPNEQVIGVSVNGDSRAYPLAMLSVHEIVDDVVGGVPVAVTY